MSGAKRVKKSNYTHSELEILTDEVMSNHSVLFSSFSSTVTNKRKIDIWDGIAEKMNANTAGGRNGVEVRKKWNDYKCQIRKKATTWRRESTMTGGGSAPPNLNAIEDQNHCQMMTVKTNRRFFLHFNFHKQRKKKRLTNNQLNISK
ncbi:myb-related transcription factor, partner of profilin-like isoform X2 [Gigantopelta aegis]|uniref:myb-related transcription factor, partner of profilin-like isoform X2 n=1 Tax=Gigantopelta aegis TaxID=1735272 RepID=UPI001B888B97|nr:myb-related transcription factor, partner of profilin-like isoform X2 [Gigantopelta aegis]XP_041356200.1 myb-related transcription factor, partner of profilin-like isoform X2 [Gigantopelta aegis]